MSVEKLFSEGEDKNAVLPLSENGLTMESSLLPQVLGGLPHSQQEMGSLSGPHFAFSLSPPGHYLAPWSLLL